MDGCMFMHPFIALSACFLSLCPFMYLHALCAPYMHACIYASTHPHSHPSIYKPTYIHAYIYTIHPQTRPFTCISIYLTRINTMNIYLIYQYFITQSYSRITKADKETHPPGFLPLCRNWSQECRQKCCMLVDNNWEYISGPIKVLTPDSHPKSPRTWAEVGRWIYYKW